MDRSDAQVDWDDKDDPEGNVQHIAENDLTPDEVESVLLDPDAKEDVSRSSGRPIVFGYTFTDRYIAVVYEVLAEDPAIVRPVTAYEIKD
jgi:hypothetical protein